MNDPHVVALFYNVKHSASVDYSDAKPLEHEEDNFKITIENDKACFTMKAHYATEKEALEAVEEYIEVWELDVGLRRGPDMFKLVYQEAQIEDRDAEIGHHRVNAGRMSWKFAVPELTGTLATSYPSPPSGLKMTPDVRSMFNRWAGYHLGKEPPASMAYFCLNILEVLAHPENSDHKNQKRKPSTARTKAAEDYKIAVEALVKIGELSSEKGGRDARKAAGRNEEDALTDPQISFLDEAVKAIIRQLAAHAYDPDPKNMPPKIKLTDLPNLMPEGG